MNKFRGQYIDRDGLKWMFGEGENVKIEVEICTACINNQYVIWGTLEKFQGIEKSTNEEVWVSFNKQK